MSKDALYYYAENLSFVQTATFTDSTGKVRTLGENGRDLLVWLCDASNQKEGFRLFHAQRYMAEDSNIHIATVKRLLPGFEQLGCLTRTGHEMRYKGRGSPTVEYVLTFYPKAWEEYDKWRTDHPEMYQKWRPGSPTSSPGATHNLAKPNTNNALPKNNWIEPEPQPQPEPKLQLVAQGNGERGEEYKYVLGKCVEWERANYQGVAGAGLLYTWRKDYAPLVVRALQERPTDDLVLWCVEMRMPYRTGYQHKPNQPAPLAHLEHVSERHTEPEPEPEPFRGAPDCPTCEGKGWYIRRDGTKWIGHTECTCVEKPPTVEQCPPESDRIRQLETDLLNKRELGSVMNGMFKRIAKEPEPF